MVFDVIKFLINWIFLYGTSTNDLSTCMHIISDYNTTYKEGTFFWVSGHICHIIMYIYVTNLLVEYYLFPYSSSTSRIPKIVLKY